MSHPTEPQHPDDTGGRWVLFWVVVMALLVALVAIAGFAMGDATASDFDGAQYQVEEPYEGAAWYQVGSTPLLVGAALVGLVGFAWMTASKTRGRTVE